MSEDDFELLARYARADDEAAFAELVRRHINLVYSVAARQLADPALAQDVTQTVFVILARKAGSLSPNTIVPGWLCRTARFAAAKAFTANQRREKREQEAFMQESALATSSDETAEQWREIHPHLDAAMAELSARDHDALVVRYFQGRSFGEVAATLGASEASAKMRVSRALEKLRKIFTKRGIRISASVLAAAVSAHSVQAAPAGLAGSVTLAAVKGTTVTASTLTLVESTLRYMAYLKMKTAASIAAAALLLGGAATVTIHSSGSGAEPPKKAAAANAQPDYSTPEATLNTLIAALGKADIKAFAAGSTPQRSEQFLARHVGRPEAELKAEAEGMAKAFSQFTIHKREEISATETRLWVKATGKSPNAPQGDRNVIMIFKKLGSDWKYDGNLE